MSMGVFAQPLLVGEVGVWPPPRIPERVAVRLFGTRNGEEAMTKMTAKDVLWAIQAKYPQNAIVPELSINDIYAREQPSDTPVHKRRIDALMFDGGQRTAIEIKVDRADLLNNETWHKTAPWRNVTHRFIYAVPAGLAEFNEFEAHWYAGLWWVHDNGSIEVRRKARVNKYPEPLPNDVVLRLAYRAHRLALLNSSAL